MLFFPKKTSRSSYAPNGSIIRSLLLILVFAAAGWGFWVNSQRQLERLNMQGTVWDETQSVSEDDRAALRSIAKLFHDRYGLGVKIHIRRAGMLEAPDTDDKTIFIGVDPETKQTIVTLPPLVRRGLPPNFLDVLKKEILAPSLTRGTYQEGIAEALHRLWTELGNPG